MHDGEEFIKAENDTFHLEKPSAWSLGTLHEALAGIEKAETNQSEFSEDRFPDYNAVVKRLVIDDNEPPTSKETPYFSHDAYYANFKHYNRDAETMEGSFGRSILYGEVVTSTNTLLEK